MAPKQKTGATAPVPAPATAPPCTLWTDVSQLCTGRRRSPRLGACAVQKSPRTTTTAAAAAADWPCIRTAPKPRYFLSKAPAIRTLITICMCTDNPTPPKERSGGSAERSRRNRPPIDPSTVPDGTGDREWEERRDRKGGPKHGLNVFRAGKGR